MIITDRNEYAEECEWIESTGGQWIDLGVHATPNTRLVLDFELTCPYPDQQRLFGVNVQSARIGDFCFTSYVAGNTVLGYACVDDGGSWMNIPTAYTDCARHTLDLDSYNGRIIYDNTTQTFSTTRTHTSSITMHLFNANNAVNNANNLNTKMRVYSCKVYESGVLKLDLVPVKLASGQGAMYDQISTKLFVNMGAGELKAGTDTFTKLEYIESTGEEYIDTGYCANHNTLLFVKARPLDISETRSLFSSRNSYQVSDFSIIWNKTGIYSSYDNTTATYSTPTLVVNTDYTIIKERNLYINNSTVNTINDRDIFYSPKTGKIFASENGTSPGKSRLYYLKIYDTNVLVRDYVPAKDPNNVVCLYERVSGTYVYNASESGAFVGGNTLIPFTSSQTYHVSSYIHKPYYTKDISYTEIPYIQSSGTQYIDTEFIASDAGMTGCGFKFKTKIQFTSLSAMSTIIGTQNPKSGWAAEYLRATSTSWQLNPPGQSISSTVSTNIIYEIDCDLRQSQGHLIVNGNTLYERTTASTSRLANYSLYIFTMSSWGRPDAFSSIQLYYMKIYDADDNLVRDYIPVLDKDNVACLYDKVTKKFFYNAGTGTFSYPASAIYTEVEYLEASGTQYVNTQIINNADIRTVTEMSFETSGANQLCGSEIGGNNGRFKWGTAGGGGLYIGYGSGNYSTSTTIGEKYIFDIQKGSQKIIDSNGVTLVQQADTSLTNFNTYPISLFKLTSSNGSTSYGSGSLRIYSFKVFANDELLADFVPCVNQENNPCLYDKVRRRGFYNSGSGSFIYGEETGEIYTNYEPDTVLTNRAAFINKGYAVIPIIYTPIDYICGNGQEVQYINTELIPSANLKVTVQVSGFDRGDAQYVFGTLTQLNGTNANGFSCTYDSSDKYWFRYGTATNNSSTSTTIAYDTINEITLSYSTGAVVNGSRLYSPGSQTFNSSAPVALLACNRPDKNAYNKSQIKLYSCKMYDNNNLVRDYIPVLDANGVPCLFDKVSYRFFYNEGIGDFTYGATTGSQTTIVQPRITYHRKDYIDYKNIYDYFTITRPTSGYTFSGIGNIFTSSRTGVSGTAKITLTAKYNMKVNMQMRKCGAGTFRLTIAGTQIFSNTSSTRNQYWNSAFTINQGQTIIFYYQSSSYQYEDIAEFFNMVVELI